MRTDRSIVAFSILILLPAGLAGPAIGDHPAVPGDGDADRIPDAAEPWVCGLQSSVMPEDGKCVREDGTGPDGSGNNYVPPTEGATDMLWTSPASPGDAWRSVAIADVDGDGEVSGDVIAGSTSSLVAFDGHTGETLWAQPTGAYRSAVADLNGDGRLEVVTYGTRAPSTTCGEPAWFGVYVFDAGTGSPVGGYEGATLVGPASELRLVDLDGDGTRDVVVSVVSPALEDASFDGVVALDGGELLRAGGSTGVGTAGEAAVRWTVETGEKRAPALGDLAAHAFEKESNPASPSLVYLSDASDAAVLAIDGSTGDTRWRIQGSSPGTVVLANLTGDEVPELLSPIDGRVQVLDAMNGSTRAAYEPAETYPLDAREGRWILPIHIDHDDQLDLVVLGTGRTADDVLKRLLVWGVDGATHEILWTSSMGTLPASASPPIPKTVDADGDGDDEVLFSQGDGLNAPASGLFQRDRPRALILDPTTGGFLWEQELSNTVGDAFASGDLDGDGDDEVVTASRSLLTAWGPTLKDLGDRAPREQSFVDGTRLTCLFSS